MFGLLNSEIAISAALRMAPPATPALPAADSGRMSPALTWPVPIVAASGVCGDCGGVEGRYCEGCEQPASNARAVPRGPAPARAFLAGCSQTSQYLSSTPPQSPQSPLAATIGTGQVK